MFTEIGLQRQMQSPSFNDEELLLILEIINDAYQKGQPPGEEKDIEKMSPEKRNEYYKKTEEHLDDYIKQYQYYYDNRYPEYREDGKLKYDKDAFEFIRDSINGLKDNEKVRSNPKSYRDNFKRKYNHLRDCPCIDGKAGDLPLQLTDAGEEIYDLLRTSGIALADPNTPSTGVERTSSPKVLS